MKEKQYFYWLNLLRALSAFLVVFSHARSNFFQIFRDLEASSQTISSKLFYAVTLLSDDGVLIFFVLSGFLVGGRTLEKIIQGHPDNPRYFAISRGVRIIIPLVASILIGTIVGIMVGTDINFWIVLCNMLSLQGVLCNTMPGMDILWTMTYIVWFYVLIYGIVLISQPKVATKCWGVVIFILSLLVFTAAGRAVGTHRLFPFVFGIMAYYLKNYRLSRGLVLTSIIVMIASSMMIQLVKPSLSHETLDIPKYPIVVLESACIAILVSQIVRCKPSSSLSCYIEKKSGFFASFSYSLYLIHLPVIVLMTHYGYPRSSVVNLWSLALWLLGIVVCYVIGYLFYLLVEKQTNRLKKYLLEKY